MANEARAEATHGPEGAPAPVPRQGTSDVKSTVHSGAARHLLGVLERDGLDPRQLLDEVGARAIDLADPENRVSMEVYVALWRAAAPRFCGGSLSLVIGGGFELDHGNVVTYVAAHSTTVQEAVERAERYRHLVNELLIPTLEMDGEIACLRQARRPGGAELGALTEAILATWARSFRLYLGAGWWPREVWFQHAAPRDTRPFDEAFRCPVRFGKPETRMIAARDSLDQPLILANPHMRTYLEQSARVQLDRLPREDRLFARVRRLVVEELRGGDPSQNRIAARLAMSPRTLQRRLKEEGVAFNDLLDDLRRELCETYLKDRSLSGQEIAFLLGYTEPSGFYRAFRRWTGHTPQQARAGDGLADGRAAGTRAPPLGSATDQQ